MLRATLTHIAADSCEPPPVPSVHTAVSYSTPSLWACPVPLTADWRCVLSAAVLVRWVSGVQVAQSVRASGIRYEV